MSNTALAVDYSKLSNISYDVESMARDVAVSIKIPESVNNLPSKYNNLDRIQAVSIFIVIGKIRETARYCGLAYNTLFSWTQTDWWADCINQAHGINRHVINARSAAVINQAFDGVQDRLTNGDYATYDHVRDEIIYKPVSAKDCAVIFGIMFTNQRINNSLATTITHSTTTHLIDIQAQFKDMSKGKLIEHDS